ncbi:MULTISPECIES: restriction endonuclease subunit S [Bacillus]|uniref:restriction endonuclease subunit S n=1 Tax=Bacillus TaxID=1386 RepID=UPI000BF34D14|nr:restriction endonuclease subunit S [Bacillus safensis]MCY7482701.1 restriction endonuclease subunit S [Bacillus safensis]MCY7514181.1 restriction endonuclease subunit S [Bacillus safensis]MCY7544664.1 restriction endonuclease subunit S [Bacillus safensis]MCY7549836.1 restriction endonuclease subunit S [Bacillus safensis]MCY7645787.1 restriction endonuclease subunit S [Bacillus safensis]
MEFNLKRYELQDVIKLKYGKNQKKVEDKNGDFPILGTGGVMGYAKEFLYDKPSVLIGRKGSINKVKYIDKPFWTVDTLFYSEINEEKVVPLYLYYYLSQIDFDYYNEGTTIPSLRTETLNRIEIFLPDLQIQKRIVSIISKFDNKLKINESIISNLEQLSQTLFKQWFIDFEFPNEEGQPYKSSGGEMVESELGEIPEGWTVKYLSENVNFLSGGTPKTKEESYWNGTIPFFTPKDAKNNLYTTTTEKSITDLGLEKCNSKLYPKNTLFITARGTVGKLALANRPMAMNQSCFALKHKEDKQFYLYNVVENLVKEIILGANGAVFNAINLNDLKRLKYVYSNERLITNFENTVSRFYEKMSLLEEENINLQKLRDTLLPKLLSGEIEIPDDLEV